MIARFLAFAALAALLAGCQTTARLSKTPPPAPPQNYFSQPAEGFLMRRVAVLPLASERVSAEALRDVTAAFHAELNKKALFEVVPVGAGELETLTGQRAFASVETLPADLLERLRERFGAEGVLFTDITHFNSYRPVAIGVRAKLVDAGNGKIRWAFDYIYDSGHPAIAEAAKKFQRQFADEHRPIADDGGSVLLSPARFAKYVASETFASLKNAP